MFQRPAQRPDGVGKPRYFGARNIPIAGLQRNTQVVIHPPVNGGNPLALVRCGEYLRCITDPASLLTSVNTQSYQAWWTSAGARRGYFGYGNTTDDSLILANETAAGGISLRTNSTNRLSIDINGFVGIATPSASGVALTVSAATSSGNVITAVSVGAGDFGFFSDSSATANCRAGLTAKNSIGQVYLALNASANDLITGSAAGDLCIRSAQGICFTGNAGTLHAKLASTGLWSVPKSPLQTAATTMATGVAASRTSTLTITSSTTVTADATLTVTVNETGTYYIDCILEVNELTSSAGGIQFALGGGTATITNGHYSGYSVTGATITAIGASTFGVVSSLATIAISGSITLIYLRGYATVSVAGTIPLRFAQLVSSANSTQVLNGGLTLIKIA